jgi:hypothetical protein
MRKLLFSISAAAGMGFVSALSVAPVAAQPVPSASSCVDGTGPNSAFYCAPRAQGNPIRACTTGGLSGTRLATCRKATADSFCRTVAFTSSAAFSVNTSGALAEVTCTGRQAGAPPVQANMTPRPQTGTVPSATTRPLQTTTPVSPSPTASAASAPTVQEDYIYATGHATLDGSVTFKPTLQVTAFGPEMTGFTTITNPESDFEAFYQQGAGAYTATRYTGTFSNNVFRGIWRESENEQGLSRVQTTCDRKDGGTLVWGQFEIRFTPDRRSFVGTKTSCDRLINEANTWDKNSWKGTLTGRAAASVAAPTGPTPVFSSSSSSSARGTTASQTRQSSAPQPAAVPAQPRAPREETIADRIAREAAEAAEQRAKEEARRGVNSAVDRLIRRPR